MNREITKIKPIECLAFPFVINGRVIEYIIRPKNRNENIGNGAGQAVLSKHRYPKPKKSST